MSFGLDPFYDVIVVGAGHAGCEAAHAAARMGSRTLLLTNDLDKIAQMSCNPSIGSPAKSQLVREIDALGGLMGRVIDQCFIQIRLLNESKGPAVQSVRAQADKTHYRRVMKETLEMVPNLHVRQGLVDAITTAIPEDATSRARLAITNSAAAVRGFAVTTHIGQVYYARAVVVTTGTFLRGRLITGDTVWAGGRAGEEPAIKLSESLAELGLPLVRLKTGTPPRIDARTIDYRHTEVQHGSAVPLHFGHYYNTADIPPSPFTMPPAPVYPHALLNGWRNQLPCYLIYTTPRFHQLIRDNLHRAPLFSGIIEGVGPRYCPSIEDKIVRFADKERHLLFLEPEGWTTTEVYVQGCNTSLPEDVQWEMLRNIPALHSVELMRIGYAIEYDAVETGEITADLQTKRLPGLFLAGQINGTTGYEEAAAQGIMAGINAVRYITGKQSIILRRDEAYIGVLIDDLVTKEIREPYRMFTSRAEYRLLIRSDNADMRLTPLAYELGLVDAARAALVAEKRFHSEQLHQLTRTVKIAPSNHVQAVCERDGLQPIKGTITAEEVLRRPCVRYHHVRTMTEHQSEQLPDVPDYIVEQVELAIRYGSYIERQQREAERIHKMEHRRIPDTFDYMALQGLRAEARQILVRFRPATLGQASRLAGINPSDVAIILFAMDRLSGTRATA